MLILTIGRLQKISIPYQGRHFQILRESGISWTGILKAQGVMQFEIPKEWGGGFNSECPEGEDGESFIRNR